MALTSVASRVVDGAVVGAIRIVGRHDVVHERAGALVRVLVAVVRCMTSVHSFHSHGHRTACGVSHRHRAKSLCAADGVCSLFPREHMHRHVAATGQSSRQDRQHADETICKRSPLAQKSTKRQGTGRGTQQRPGGVRTHIHAVLVEHALQRVALAQRDVVVAVGGRVVLQHLVDAGAWRVSTGVTPACSCSATDMSFACRTCKEESAPGTQEFHHALRVAKVCTAGYEMEISVSGHGHRHLLLSHLYAWLSSLAALAPVYSA